MELLFLGTGAADWNISKRVDGEFFRRFSSALVDDALLIDPGPHIFDFAEKNGTPELYRNVRSVAVTHSHGDHLNAESVKRLAAAGGLTVYCDPAVEKKLRDAGVSGVDFVPLTPFESVTTPDGYEIVWKTGPVTLTRHLRSSHAARTTDRISPARIRLISL